MYSAPDCPVIVDELLPLPSPPRQLDAIPASEGALQRPGVANTMPMVCAGRRCLVRASALHGVLVADADGAPLVGRVQLETAIAANGITTPRSLTRELVGAAGSTRETLLVPERLPGFVLQWQGWAPDEGWRLGVELFADARTRVRIDGPMLRIADEAGAGLVLYLATAAKGAGEAAGQADVWRVVDGPGGVGQVAAQVHCSGDVPTTLLVHAIPEGDRMPSLSALGAVGAHRVRDDLEPDEAAGLQIESGIADLDRGVAWARAALRALVEETSAGAEVRVLAPHVEGDESARLAMGALAAGEWEVAQAALQSAALQSAGSMTSREALALAEWVAWTAQPQLLIQHTDAIARSAEVPGAFSASDLQRLIDAAEAAGADDLVARLRTVPAPASSGSPATPSSQNTPLPSQTTARRLPTISSPTTTSSSTTNDTPVHVPGLASPDATSDWVALRTTLSALVRQGGSPEGFEAAESLETLVVRVLGVEPDAAYGRLRLAPQLPAHLTRFGFRGLRVGDATVGAEMSRQTGLSADQKTVAGVEREVVEWRLRQTAGGAPITWIFEPTLPLQSVEHVSVDGQPAELDVSPAPGGIRVKVQVPAERERVVRVEGTALAISPA